MESHRRILAQAGYPVRVVAGRGAAELVPEVDSRHPAVEAVTAGLAAGADVAAAFAALTAVIRERLRRVLADTDLLIVHNVMTMHFNLPLTAALAGEWRVLAWTHDLAWANDRYAAFRRPGFPYDLLHSPSPGVRYVAISQPVGERLREIYSVPAAEVPNGIDRFAQLRIRAATAERLRASGLADADPLILIPFRITRRKRLELALRMLAVLAPRHPRLKLVVSGPLGPHSVDNVAYWRELDGLRSELGLGSTAVFLHELGRPAEPGHPVDDEMVAELYQLASLVLLPSEAEGFGLPVLEAGLVRVPVVCTDLPVFRAVAGDNLWRFPMDAGPEVIAEVVEAALATRQARLQSRVQSQFGWSQILPRLEEEIRLALA